MAQVIDQKQLSEWFGSAAQTDLASKIERLTQCIPSQGAQQLQKQFKQFTSQGAQYQSLLKQQQELTQLQETKQEQKAAQVKAEQSNEHNGNPHERSESQHAHPKEAEAVSATTVQEASNQPQQEGGLVGDELLLTVFSVADSLTRDEIRVLAAKGGFSQHHVQTTFSKLRSTIRTALQRMQNKALRDAGIANPGLHINMQNSNGGSVLVSDEQPNGSNSQPEQPLIHQPNPATEQLAKLAQFLDNQGRLSPTIVGNTAFVILMQEACSYEVKEAQLKAISISPPSVLFPLVGAHLLNMLHAWITLAETDKQMSFIRIALQAIRALPIPLPLLQTSKLLIAVSALVRNKHARTSAAAQSLLAHWQSNYEGLSLPAAIQKALAGTTRVTAGGAVATRFTPAYVPSKAAGRPAPADGFEAIFGLGPGLGRPGQGHARRGTAINSLGSPTCTAGLHGTVSEKVFGKAGSRAAGMPSAEQRAAALALPLGRQGSVGQAASQALATLQVQQQLQASNLSAKIGPASFVNKPGPSHYSDKPLSADDIRKQREKQRAREAYAGIGQAKPLIPGFNRAIPGMGFLSSPSKAKSGSAAHQHIAVPQNTASFSNGDVRPAKRQALGGPTGNPVSAINPQGSFHAASTNLQSQSSVSASSFSNANAAADVSKAQGTASAQQMDVDVDDEYDMQIIQRLLQNKKRRDHITHSARAFTADPALLKEIVEVVMANDEKAEAMQAAREKYSQRILEATASLAEALLQLQPSLTWQPPAPIAQPQWDPNQIPPGAGEESSEVDTIRRRHAHPMPAARRPPQPLEPPSFEQGQSSSTVADIPWMSNIPEEADMQNQRMWDRGIRSPFLVQPPRHARAGALPKPPPPPVFMPLTTAPSSTGVNAAQQQQGTAREAKQASALHQYPAQQAMQASSASGTSSAHTNHHSYHTQQAAVSSSQHALQSQSLAGFHKQALTSLPLYQSVPAVQVTQSTSTTSQPAATMALLQTLLGNAVVIQPQQAQPQQVQQQQQQQQQGLTAAQLLAYQQAYQAAYQQVLLQTQLQQQQQAQQQQQQQAQQAPGVQQLLATLVQQQQQQSNSSAVPQQSLLQGLFKPMTNQNQR